MNSLREGSPKLEIVIGASQSSKAEHYPGGDTPCRKIEESHASRPMLKDRTQSAAKVTSRLTTAKSGNKRSAIPINLTAHYRKPLPGQRKHLNAVLELIARLAVRAALQRSNKHLEVSTDSADSSDPKLTSATNHIMFSENNTLSSK